jgi:cobalamin biosynthesis Mg chelatase CobN
VTVSEQPTAPGQVPPWWTDPTENVKTLGENIKDLVVAAIQRQDDLRTAESRHVREMAQIRAAHAAEMRQAETARIDAIRAVDVGAVNRAAEVSATQATTLATQVATSAEALRGQVEAARQQTATALAAALEPIQKDIQDLRRAQYEAQGQKTQVVETRQGGQYQLAILGAILAAAAIIVTILLATGH